MADGWKEIASDSFSAAQAMLLKGHFRSCVSRCYYASFSAATGELVKIKTARTEFEYGRNHPTHRQLAGLVRQHLPHLPHWNLSFLVSAIRRLYKARIDSDYICGATIDGTLARNMVRDSHKVLKILGAVK